MPLLSLPIEGNILALLYIALLLKLSIKIFLTAIRNSSVELGRLGLYSLEIDFLLQVTNLFASLYIADRLIQFLLKVMMESINLEIGVIILFLLYHIKTLKS